MLRTPYLAAPLLLLGACGEIGTVIATPMADEPTYQTKAGLKAEADMMAAEGARHIALPR